jgi:hypothetical protein
MSDHIPACPICGRPSQAASDCPHCGASLAGYLRGYYRPWACYNRALELAAAGRPAAAAREAYVATFLSPQQYHFLMLLSRLLDAAGEADEAIAQAELADELSPGNSEVETWLAALLARKYEQMLKAPGDQIPAP